nr:ABC transporter ATP-binding protein [Arenicellales bacterium]
MNTPAVEFLDIGMRFGETIALAEINLSIHEGAYLVLLGPSGGGKTTLLNILGGFLKPTSGHVKIYGHDVTDVPAAKRPTATVFQDYALFPHMNISANVGFGLKMRKVSGIEREKRVTQVLEMVGLEHAAGH